MQTARVARARVEVDDQEEVSMALRAFVGPDGREWQVWDTRPTTPAPNVRSPGASSTARPFDTGSEFGRVSKKREGGWLTFTAETERRRLSPIPDEWEQADETALRALLAAADPITTTERSEEHSDQRPGSSSPTPGSP